MILDAFLAFSINQSLTGAAGTAVSTNIIDASYNALHDSLTYKLWREGRRA